MAVKTNNGRQCAPQFPAALLSAPLIPWLARYNRDQLEHLIETAIDLLDRTEGDTDAEDGDEDSCPARDDTGGVHPNDCYGDGLAGDPADAEEDDPSGLASVK